MGNANEHEALLGKTARNGNGVDQQEWQETLERQKAKPSRKTETAKAAGPDKTITVTRNADGSLNARVVDHVGQEAFARSFRNAIIPWMNMVAGQVGKADSETKNELRLELKPALDKLAKENESLRADLAALRADLTIQAAALRAVNAQQQPPRKASQPIIRKVRR
jgi:hypothetical protein